MDALLDGYSTIMEFPVAWGDMDAFSHVNNARYFTYFETARIHYFEKIDVMSHMEKTREGPILASTQCRFKIPLTYPDTLSLGVRVSRLDIDRFVMEYIVVSHERQAVAAVGEGLIVYINYGTNKKTAVPDSIRTRIMGIEGSGVEVIAADAP